MYTYVVRLFNYKGNYAERLAATKEEVSSLLQGLGFEYCKDTKKWEQLYLHVDPYSVEADEVFNTVDIVKCPLW